MKKLFAVAALSVICSPFIATVAKASYEPYKPHHWKTRATEMMTLGLATAVVGGGLGYLALRRRTRTN